jgi:hypothetical protein
MTEETAAELWFCDVLVAKVMDVVCHQGTYFGIPQLVFDNAGSELQRRLTQFVDFSLDWNRRVGDGIEADADEFDAFADLVRGGNWSCRYRGAMSPIDQAPSFFGPNECSWVLAR